MTEVVWDGVCVCTSLLEDAFAGSCQVVRKTFVVCLCI